MRRLFSPRLIRSLLCIGVFLITLAATYNCVLFGNQSDLCGGYDVYRYMGPYSYYMDYVLHHGEVPYWNPLTLCGMPFAANPVVKLFYPFNLLRSLLTFHPTPFKTQMGWMIMFVLHLLVAGMAIVLLARDHNLSYGASFVAAFVFMFGANWTRRISEYHFICMVAWLPVLLVLVRRALSQEALRPKLRYGLICGLILGCSLLSGDMNIVPYMGVTLGGYAVLYRVLGIRSFAELRKEGFLKRISGDVAFLVIMFALSGLVASALLLPGSEFASFTGRVKGTEQELAHPHYAGTWQDLYHILIRFPGLKWEVENIRGAGIGALVLVAAGLLSRRWREILLYGILSLILFDCSMGRPFPIATILEYLSPIQLIASTRAWDFAVLPLGMLAAFGVDAIAAATRPLWWRGVRDGTLLIVGIVALYSLSFLLGPKSFLSMGRTALVLPGCMLAAVIIASWMPRWSFWPVVLAALMFAETLAWNNTYVPFIVTQKNFATFAHRYPGATSFWSDNRRGIDLFQDRLLYELKPAMHGYEPLHMSHVRNVLAGDSRANSYQRSVKDYEVTRENQRGNLFLKRAFWLARQYVRGPLPNKQSLFPPTTTVFLPQADDLPIPRVDAAQAPNRSVSEGAKEIRFLGEEQLKPINARLQSLAKKQQVNLPALKMPGMHSALCMRYTSGCAATVEATFRDPDTGEVQFGKTNKIRPTTKGSALLELPLPDFKTLRTELTISANTPDGRFQFEDVYLLADPADEDSLIRIVSRTANTVEVNVGELGGYRVLTFLDAAYPGWSAYLDGKETRILLADDAFKAVVVPPGNHVIRFMFRPKRVYIGIGITITAASAALAAIVLLRPKKVLSPVQ